MTTTASLPEAPPVYSPSSSQKIIYIGSRSSKLALIQTNIVRDTLVAAYPELNFEIISMTTTGDNNQTKPLHSFGAKALWTQELEVLLLDYRLDMIVHSLKGSCVTEEERRQESDFIECYRHANPAPCGL